METTVTARKARLFVIAWCTITVAAFVLSGLVFHFPGAFPPNNGEAFNPDGFLGAVINGLASGILVGVSQALLMRVIGQGTWRWAAFTAVALWLVHTIGDVFPDSMALPLMTLLGGLLLGCAQWWALRWPPKPGLLWLAATAVPWTAGILLGRLLSAGADWRTEHVIAGLWPGILVGAATAGVWLWIWSERPSLEKRVERARFL